MRHVPFATAVVAAVLFASGCNSDDDTPAAAATPASTTTAPSAPAASPADLTPEQKASAASAAGLPPSPDAATTTKFIRALNAIDPAIVNGKNDKAVSRALSQCQIIKTSPQTTDADLVAGVQRRFIGPNNPDGFGPAKSAQILQAVRTHICPTY